MRRRLRAFACIALVIVLVLSVIAKAFSLDSFARTTSTLTFVPWHIRQWLPLLIPSEEVLLAYLIMLPRVRQIGLCLMLANLVAFTAFLIWRLGNPYAPPCNCFGLIHLASDARTENQLAVARNLLLLALNMLALWPVGAPNELSATAKNLAEGGDRTSRGDGVALARVRAFTITELLVVCGVVAVVMSLLLPTLSKARRQARVLECASHLREIGYACHLRAVEKGGYVALAGTIHLPASTGPYTLPRLLQDDAKRRYAYLPDEGDGAVYNPTREQPAPFAMALAPYLSSKSSPASAGATGWNSMGAAARVIFSCPSSDRQPNDHGGEPNVELHFADMSFSTNWYTPVDYAVNEALFGFHFDPAYAARRKRGRLSATRDAARVVMLGDAKCDLRTSPTTCWTPTLDGVGAVTLTDVLRATANVSSFVRLDAVRHRNRLNVLYLDGHVETLQMDAAALAGSYLVAP